MSIRVNVAISLGDSNTKEAWKKLMDTMNSTSPQISWEAVSATEADGKPVDLDTVSREYWDEHLKTKL